MQAWWAVSWKIDNCFQSHNRHINFILQECISRLHTLPVRRISLIEYRNKKAICYTYESEKYRLPTTKEELLQLSEVHGFYWFSPFYGFVLEGIAHLVPGRDGALYISLREGIEPLHQKQVTRAGSEVEGQQYCIKIHKNNARKVRDQYTELTTEKGHQVVTYEEFSEYAGIPLEVVLRACFGG